MNIRIMAISTFTPELMSGSRSPYPENERGPMNTTIKPPPIIIKTHIAKMNENSGKDTRYLLPS